MFILILIVLLTLLLIISFPIFLLIIPYIIIFICSYILIAIIVIITGISFETGKLGKIYADNFICITFIISLVLTILLRYYKYDTFSRYFSL